MNAPKCMQYFILQKLATNNIFINLVFEIDFKIRNETKSIYIWENKL